MTSRSLSSLEPSSKEAVEYQVRFQQFYKKVGENIKKERDRQKITNDKLAAALHLSHATVIMWQNGKRTPSAFDIYRTSLAFGVPFSALLAGIQEDTDTQYQSGFYAGCMAALEAMKTAVSGIAAEGPEDEDKDDD